MPLDKRSMGILLHPTSLSGKWGIGDFGPSAYKFADWVRRAGMSYWQILPLGPTGFGDSPYQCFSAFAGNPLLISPELLLESGLLSQGDIAGNYENHDNVSYGDVFYWKQIWLRTAYNNFVSQGNLAFREEFETWKGSDSVVHWLDDYALFMSLKNYHEGKSWILWDKGLKERMADALVWAKNKLKDEIEFQKFVQFLFFTQWGNLKKYVNSLGIEIIGDAPIYVSFDSADTWANQNLFLLNNDGSPSVVAGVPPDYFSETGQLWGNPLYNWETMAADGYAWWIERLKAIFETVDIVRLDHFRGFMGYYAVPADHKTAELGRWHPGPGADFFEAIRNAIGNLPIIAEDLGEITGDVTAVRHQFQLPGMIVLQFAWSPATGLPTATDPNNNFLPHLHEKNSVVYTGTHDNDTTLGWWNHSSTAGERSLMQIYLSVDGNMANRDLIRCGMASVSNTFIVPAQDLLDLDSEARMNLPGRAEGNWSWRLKPGQFNDGNADAIYAMSLLYGRCGNPPAEAVIKPPKLPLY